MSPCAGCHAGCCRAFAVPLTGADIVRLERELGATFLDFACRWEDRDGKIAGELMPHFHFADEPETPFAICLLHDASLNAPETTKCRFLLEEPPTEEHPLGTARCEIYAVRPTTCRVFPTSLNKAGTLALLHDVPERGRPAEQGEVYRLCPRPWQTHDVDPIVALQDLVVLRFEMQFFWQLAHSWNKFPGAWEDFPIFLREVYHNRVLPAPLTRDSAEFEPYQERLSPARAA